MLSISGAAANVKDSSTSYVPDTLIWQTKNRCQSMTGDTIRFGGRKVRKWFLSPCLLPSER
jgi:hypothetical protein